MVYIGLDFTKFVCAILIVYMHTFCYDSTLGLWVREVISTIGVPFFFITSGFFLYKGMEKSSDNTAYIRKYTKRLLYLYVAWFFISLPVSWYNVSIAHVDYSFWMKCLYHVRMLLFSGAMGVYWYILAMILSSWMIYIAIKLKMINACVPIAIVLFLLGVLYQSGLLQDSFIDRFIHVVFGSERNFLNVGFPYVLIGVVVARKNISIPRQFSLCLLILSILVSTFLMHSKWHFIQLFESLFLFLLIKECNPQGNSCTNIAVWLRKCSTAMYLIHFPFIIAFDYYLQKGTLVDFPVTLCFSFAVFLLLKRLPDKYVKILFG